MPNDRDAPPGMVGGESCGGGPEEMAAALSGRCAVNGADVRLLRVMATLVGCLPAERRAAHLASECEALADRMDAATGRER